jgi:hypothetical protein
MSNRNKSKEYKIGKLEITYNIKYHLIFLAIFYGDKKIMLKYIERRDLSRYKYNIMTAFRMLQFWPVYLEVWSRDCDMCESRHAYRFPTYWHAYRYMQDMRHNWSEGPCSFAFITRKDYENYESTSRDLILEAFEDGRGSHVTI